MKFGYNILQRQIKLFFGENCLKSPLKTFKYKVQITPYIKLQHTERNKARYQDSMQKCAKRTIRNRGFYCDY